MVALIAGDNKVLTVIGASPCPRPLVVDCEAIDGTLAPLPGDTPATVMAIGSIDSPDSVDPVSPVSLISLG